MGKSLRAYYQNHPLKSILLIGFIVRIIAAIFSKGYAFQDDQFLVVEVAQKWIEGVECEWLPWLGGTHASGHSLFYPGMHFFFFKGLKWLGLVNPEWVILLVRVVHACYSLTIIYYGFRIVQWFHGDALARKVGWILALFWMFPMLSVRNLVEFTCIPPLMVAIYWAIKYPEKNQWKQQLLMGIIAGLAISFRFQTVLFVGGMGLVFLIQREWLKTIVFGVGVALSVAVFQGLVDYNIWGVPFAEFQEYVNYNWHHSGEYPNGPWYNYFLLILGVFIPPLSFMFFAGNIRSFRKYLLLALPVFVFFAFHSYFPNKQERFVLPVFPFFIILGMMGWRDFLDQPRKSTINWNVFYTGSVKFFWVLNTVLLFVLTPASTKISRVEVMNYLRENHPEGQMQDGFFALETTHMWGTVLMPRFYQAEQGGVSSDVEQCRRSQIGCPRS